jgi:hypothetical protein
VALGLLALFALAILALAGVAWRAHHRHDLALATYRAARAAHRAAHPRASPGDAAVWAAISTQVRALERARDAAYAGEDRAVAAWRRGSAEPPPAVAAFSAAHAAELADLRARLHTRPPLAADAGELSSVTGSLVTLSHASDLIADDARAASNPVSDLRALDDALAIAHAAPWVVSAMIGEHIGDDRDAAYLAATLARHDEADGTGAWIREGSRQLGWLGDALANERDDFVGPRFDRFIGLDLDDLAREYLNVQGPIGMGDRWDSWWAQQALPEEALGEIQALDEGQARLRDLQGRLDHVDPNQPILDAGSLAQLQTENWIRQAAANALAAETRERLRRAAAIALWIQEDTGALPADEAALRLASADLADAPDRLRLRYERLGPDRFRVTVDPATALPEYAWPGMASTSRLGAPPAAQPGLSREGTTLELVRSGPGMPWAVQ